MHLIQQKPSEKSWKHQGNCTVGTPPCTHSFLMYLWVERLSHYRDKWKVPSLVGVAVAKPIAFAAFFVCFLINPWYYSLCKPQSQLTQGTELFLLALIEICDAAWMLQACICLLAHCDKWEATSSEEMGYKCNDRVTVLFAMSVCCMSMEMKV